jgi:hypothetical protein
MKAYCPKYESRDAAVSLPPDAKAGALAAAQVAEERFSSRGGADLQWPLIVALLEGTEDVESLFEVQLRTGPTFVARPYLERM